MDFSRPRYPLPAAGAEVAAGAPYRAARRNRHLAAGSFEYLMGEDFPTFRGAPFRFDIISVELTFGGNLVLDNLGRAISRLSLRWYERHAAWIFPALDIRCRLRARK